MEFLCKDIIKMKLKVSSKFIILGIYFVFVILLVYILVKYLGQNISNDTVKCNMKFGLCPAAKCIPTPYDENKAYCWCDVVSGTNYSVGNNDCEKIKPYTLGKDQEIIFSDFSPVISKMGYHVTNCPPEAVNLNCMNKICSVDPNNPSKAVCICDKLDNKGLDWVTYNKNGEPKTCNYQSGASMQSYLNLKTFIKQNA
jgi:hypothetical protein